MPENIQMFQLLIKHPTDPVPEAPFGWITNGTLWFNTTDSYWYERQGDSWVKIAGLPTHTHPELGDVEQVNFVDKLTVDGNEGWTEEIKLGDGTVLVFQKGILVKHG